MYKKLVTFTVVLLTTACSTTPAKLLESTPEHTFMSDHSAKAVANCIVKKWDQTAPVVSIRETEVGQRVIMYNGGKIIYMAEIEQRGNGSKTRVYTHMVIVIGEDPTVKSVEICQNN